MPTPIAVQQDATEFVTSFFDQVETRLKGTAQEGLLATVCAGTQVYQKRCTKCNTISAREETLLMMKVEIKNTTDIYGGLRDSAKEERLDGVECDVCKEKTTAARRALIGRTPNIFIVNFNRLVFNYDTFQREKINTRVEFPTELDIAPYTVAGAAAEAAAAAAAAATATPDAAAAPAPATPSGAAPPAPASPASSGPSDTQYRLVGVVCHMGSADSGHYYSFIRDRATGSWHEYNDSIVRTFELSRLEQECFGGMQEFTEVTQYGTAYTSKSEAIKNAYICLYEKVHRNELDDAVSLARVAAGLPPRVGEGGKGADTPASATDAAADAGEEEGAGAVVGVASAPAGAGAAAVAPPPVDTLAALGQSAFRAHLRGVAERIAASQHGSAARAAVFRSVVPQPTYQLVATDNISFARDCAVYSPEFSTFVADLVGAVAASVTGSTLSNTPLTPSDVSCVADAVACTAEFTFEVLAKADKSSAAVENIGRHLLRLLRPPMDDTAAAAAAQAAGVACARTILARLASNPAQLGDLLLVCPEEKIRTTLSSIITAALALLLATPVEQAHAVQAAVTAGVLSGASSDGGSDVGAVGGFLATLLALLPDAAKNWPRFREYFALFTTLCKAAVTCAACTPEELAAGARAPAPAQLVQPLALLLAPGNRLVARIIDLFLGDESPLAVPTAKSPVPAVGSSSTTPPWDSAAEYIAEVLEGLRCAGFPASSTSAEDADAAASATAAGRVVRGDGPLLPRPLGLTADEETVLAQPQWWLKSITTPFAPHAMVRIAQLLLAGGEGVDTLPACRFFTHLVCLAISACTPESAKQLVPITRVLLESCTPKTKTNPDDVLAALQRITVVLGDVHHGTVLAGVALGLPALPEAAGGEQPESTERQPDAPPVDWGVEGEKPVPVPPRQLAPSLEAVLPFPPAAVTTFEDRMTYLSALGVRAGSGMLRALMRKRVLQDRVVEAVLGEVMRVAETAPLLNAYLFRMPALDPATEDTYMDVWKRFYMRLWDMYTAPPAQATSSPAAGGAGASVSVQFSNVDDGASSNATAGTGDKRHPWDSAMDDLATLLRCARSYGEHLDRLQTVAAIDEMDMDALVYMPRVPGPYNRPLDPAEVERPTDPWRETGMQGMSFASADRWLGLDMAVLRAMKHCTPVASSYDKGITIAMFSYKHPYGYGADAGTDAVPAPSSTEPTSSRYAMPPLRRPPGWTHAFLVCNMTGAVDSQGAGPVHLQRAGGVG